MNIITILVNIFINLCRKIGDFMNDDLLDLVCSIESDFSQISDFVRILKDAVENSDEASYLLPYVEIINSKTDQFADVLEEYNQKISKLAVNCNN